MSQILTDAAVARNDTPIYGTFFVDSTIGNETSLTFSYSEMIEVKVQSSEEIYTAETHKDCFRNDESSRVLKVMIPGNATVRTIISFLSKIYFSPNASC